MQRAPHLKLFKDLAQGWFGPLKTSDNTLPRNEVSGSAL